MTGRLSTVAGGLAVFCACGLVTEPQVHFNKELFDQLRAKTFEEAPIIVVGTLRAQKVLRRGVPHRYRDTEFLTDLVRFSADVEISLRGGLPTGPVEINMFLFSDLNTRWFGKKEFVPQLGRRYVMPLRRTNGVIRPMIDLIGTFETVRTGLPRASSALPSDAIESVCRAMMVRGDGIGTRDYLVGLFDGAYSCSGLSRQATRKLLGEIMTSPDPDTSATACFLLSMTLNEHDCLCAKQTMGLMPEVQEDIRRARKQATTERGTRFECVPTVE